MLLSLAVVAPTSAVQSADPDPSKQKKKVDAQVEQLKEDLHETNAQLAAAYTALKTTQGKLPGAQAALSQAQSAAARAENANAVAAQELEVAQANETKAQEELKATSTEISRSREQVAQFAAQIYQDQGFGELDMAMTSTSPQQFADRIALIGTVMDLQSRSIEELATSRASLTAQEDRLSALRADSERAKRKAESTLAAANAARDKASAAKAALDQLAAQQTTQAAAVQSQQAAEKARLAGMQAEQSRLSAVIKARAAEALRRAKIRAEANRKAKAAAAARAAAAAAASRKNRDSGSSKPPASSSSGGPLSPPTTVGWISSEYGMRFHPIFREWRLHSGRDYAAPCGTPLKAAADGVVIESGDRGGYGNRVVIDHGVMGGVSLATTYNHMESIKVWGGRVKRGQTVGYVGTTGNSTGCHEHFEVYEDGEFTDPRNYL
ncbi:murein DD-endopeptidase MepM/ murein hydrolase activator NlpD [Knoellia remsis]|uniref:Murein DD-endopeptidase MepM/ murein hydrolase activator NlpD n=2 Tax=Knoellia remsis TaxID=407159 RepID=A0A2T0UY08_9MICO|nr:murein DD-endopeptidase MepM/ murein hydrolase activator NlpD [Knoellia remsis]